MKYLLHIAIILIFANSIFAQNIQEKQVPEPIKKVFRKKNPTAQEVAWQKKDTNYIVNFTTNKLKNTNHYSPSAVLIEQHNEITYDKLSPQIQNYCRDKYPDYKFKTAETVVKGKEKYTAVFLYKKASRKGEEYITEVQFSPSGKFLAAFEADIPDEVKKEKNDNKFEKKTTQDTDEMAETEFQEQTVSRKELPKPIQDYLSANYDYDWNTKVCQLKHDPELGTVYYIVMKKEGNKDTWEHYFEVSGKLIRRSEIK